MIAVWKKELLEAASPGKIEVFKKFFKTGPGEYGEGDSFIGLSVPANRSISRRYHDAPLEVIDSMISDPIHEYRLAGLLALVERYRRNKSPMSRQEIAAHYITICHKANNWDLVDLSCEYIIGEELVAGRCFDELRRLSRSSIVWERRAAVVSTLTPIRHRQLDIAIEMCESLLDDSHQLINKAVGWVLRECGKKDRNALETFLSSNISRMPSVTISYALEKFTAEERLFWRNLRKNQ